jgi:hypothetical protein
VALSDREKEKDKKRPNRAVNAGSNYRWSDKQKIEAATSWLVFGNMSMISRLTGIPRITLCKWQETEWWHTLIEELKVQEKIELSAKMKNLVQAAHTVVANRLENGDAVLNQKTGEIVYKPVSMKDAHRVAVDMLNQKQVLDKAHSGPEIAHAEGDKLQQLAEKFAEFATKSIEKNIDKRRTIDEDITDVEIKMAPTESLSTELLLDHRLESVQEVDEAEQTSSREN